MLRATTACNFSSLIWPAGSAPAALASLLFDPPEPQIIGKTERFATFSVSRRSYLFAHLHLLSSDLFSSDSSHLCFSTVHIVGSFTSKLPSIIYNYVVVYSHGLILLYSVSFCRSKNIKPNLYTYKFIEGSLEVKLPTIWTVEKQR